MSKSKVSYKVGDFYLSNKGKILVEILKTGKTSTTVRWHMCVPSYSQNVYEDVHGEAHGLDPMQYWITLLGLRLLSSEQAKAILHLWQSKR